MAQGHDKDAAWAICKSAMKGSEKPVSAAEEVWKLAKEQFDELETTELKDIEIFQAGVWRGEEWTPEDLDQMARNFAKVRDYLKPVLKLGHPDDQKFAQNEGLPAFGWMTDLKRAGNKLVASFSDVPRKLADLVKAKAYRRVSAEIYRNFKDQTGKAIGKTLRAVALLGSDTPEIKTLDDVKALYGEAEPVFVPFGDDQEAVAVFQDVELMELRSKVNRAVMGTLAPNVHGFIREVHVLDEDGLQGFAIVETARQTDGAEVDHEPERFLWRYDWQMNDGDVELSDPQKVRVEFVPAEANPSQPNKTDEEQMTEGHTGQGDEDPAAGGESADHDGEVTSMPEETTTQTQDQFAEREKQLQAEIAKYKADAERVQTLEQELAAERAAKRQAEVQQFVDSQKAEGRVLPRFEAPLVALMSNLDDEQVVKYTEDGKQVEAKPADLLRQFVESLPKLVEFRETSEADGDGGPADTPDDPQSAYMAEVEKVMKRDGIDDFSQAARKVDAEKPDLFKAYERAIYARGPAPE